MNGYTESPDKIAERAQRRLCAQIVHDCTEQMADFLHGVQRACGDPLGVMFDEMVMEDKWLAEVTAMGEDADDEQRTIQEASY